MKSGIVYLVGAGPGDPGLITVRGRQILAEAEVIVYDRLIGAELLASCRDDAEKVYVGKEADRHALPQEAINALLVEKAQLGKNVCRLKGGDPFVFGRGGEEALHCRANGVRFEIVPGVSSSIAAPAYAGIPVTQRPDDSLTRGASSFAVVTGHTKDEEAPPAQLPVADTLVFLMGVRALPRIVAQLLERGDAPTTPVALVRWGTTSQQQVVTGTLETIEADVARAGLKPPALIVVGEVVRLREHLQWFDDVSIRPLWGQTIVVTRAREQASSLVEQLQQRGARVIQCPTIQVRELDDYSLLDSALASLHDSPRTAPTFAWVVFTSVNGVEQCWKRIRALNFDARLFAGTGIVAIGPATVQALQRHGLHPDFVPSISISETVAAEMVATGVADSDVLILRAHEGREILPEKLTAAGARVVVAPCYETVPDHAEAEMVREAMKAGEIDWITFTSSSTVRNLIEAIGLETIQAHRTDFRVACIGPVTATTCREFGIEPDAMAEQSSVEALVAALTG